MPYGRPYSTGHGYRRPDYIWSPVFMPCAHRRRRKVAAQHSRCPSARKQNLAGELALSALDGLADILFNGRRSQILPALLGKMLFFAIMSQSMTAMVLGLLALFCRLLKESQSYATAEIVKDYKEKTKAIRIKRKTSVNLPPTAEALRKAWVASRKSLAGKLLAGTLLSDLEPVVDQSYVRTEDGTIVGRRPGIKGWLLLNCPDMLPHYKALMNYKALADKLRRALGIEEPDTLAAVLDFGEGDAPKSLRFHERFSLRNTDEKTVREGIRAMFGSAATAPGEAEAAQPKTSVDAPGETAGEEVRKTSVNGPEGMSGTTVPKTSVKVEEEAAGKQVQKTSIKETATGEMMPKTSGKWPGVKAEGDTKWPCVTRTTEPGATRTASGAMANNAEKTTNATMAVITTMAALEEVVRERLGLCWMRRTGRARKAA